LANKEIDAVIICTPDHWHAKPAIEALKIGKDVYCEKPLSHTIIEGRAMVQATRKYDRIFQTGSMQRSWKDFRKACQIVRGGYLGEIKNVIVNVGGPSSPYNLKEENIRPEINWNKWVGPAFYQYYNSILAPPLPLDKWPLWRAYNEFGGGGVTDWGAHMFDIVQWALGMDDTGPIVFNPPKMKGQKRGFNFSYANGVRVKHMDFGKGYAVKFEGTEGNLTVSREFLETSIPMLAEREFNKDDQHITWSNNHYKNFIDCIKTRNKPVADIEIGHRTATICNIGNITYQLGRSLYWDPDNEKFINDDYANSKLGKEYRKGFELPSI
jgi:predicted dehydrogenase